MRNTNTKVLECFIRRGFHFLRRQCRSINTKTVCSCIFCSNVPICEEDMRETDAFDRWGRAMAGGYQVVPNQLLRLQKSLGLSSHQVVILLNLSMHWWKKKDLPFITSYHIAKRMGMSRRTVERQLRKLCDRGYVQKKTLPDHEDMNGEPRVGYDLSGLILALESSPVEVKSRNLQRRIDALPRD
jgi:DNA-binding HxlR family transcriptional regulator